MKNRTDSVEGCLAHFVSCDEMKKNTILAVAGVVSKNILFDQIPSRPWIAANNHTTVLIDYPPQIASTTPSGLVTAIQNNLALISKIAIAGLSTDACQRSPSSNPSREIDTKELNAKIGSSPMVSSKYFLSVQPQGTQLSPKSIRNVVVGAGTGKLILDESLVPSYINWPSESTREMPSVRGTIKVDENLSSFKREINIPTKNQNE